jgi:hypothetical protein
LIEYFKYKKDFKKVNELLDEFSKLSTLKKHPDNAKLLSNSQISQVTETQSNEENIKYLDKLKNNFKENPDWHWYEFFSELGK